MLSRSAATYSVAAILSVILAAGAMALGFVLKKTLRRLSEKFLEDPDNMDLLIKFETAARMAKDLPFEVNVWRAQNNFYSMLEQTLPEKESRARTDDADARAWVDHFVSLGRNLSVKVDAPSQSQAA